MKTLRDYITETDRKISNPVTGDVVSFVVNESLAIECDVVEHGDDYIVIEADEITESVLVESECTMERIARYGAVGSNRGMGFSMSEDYDKDEYDEEGEMAKSQARTIADAAQDIENMLGDDENLPEWVQGKITKAADYVDTARDYLKANRPEEKEEDSDFARIMELAGIDDAASSDPLAAKAAGLAPVGADGDEDSQVTVDEGVMSEIDIDLHEIARNEDYDRLYDLLTASSATGQFVQNMYDEVAREYRLHPDDDQDVIIERLMDRISDDYGDPDFDPAEQMDEAEYQGREVQLGKPTKGDIKKFKVYVKDPKTGNVKKVNFGDPNMEIKRDDPKRRKSFRARHGCGTPRASDRTKAAYWSCRMWSKKPVSKIV